MTAVESVAREGARRGLRAHRDYVDFHQDAARGGRQRYVHRSAGGRVRLVLGSEELADTGSRLQGVSPEVFRWIAPDVDAHHHYVAQRELLRCEKRLHVLENPHGLRLDVGMGLHVRVEPAAHIESVSGPYRLGKWKVSVRWVLTRCQGYPLDRL